MSETFVPRPGDRVRFYSWAEQMDLTGEVLSVAPQSRMATVRDDREDGQTFIKSWDVLRPVQLSGHAMVTRLLAERDEAIARAENAEADLAKQIEATSAHFTRVRELDKRLSDMEADRDGWVKEANDNQFISRMGYKERDEARAQLKDLAAKYDELHRDWLAAEARVEELEDQNRILKSDLAHQDSVVGGYRERANQAEANTIRITAALQELRSALLDLP